jgi:hypothetical protein
MPTHFTAYLSVAPILPVEAKLPDVPFRKTLRATAWVQGRFEVAQVTGPGCRASRQKGLEFNLPPVNSLALSSCAQKRYKRSSGGLKCSGAACALAEASYCTRCEQVLFRQARIWPLNSCRCRGSRITAKSGG